MRRHTHRHTSSKRRREVYIKKLILGLAAFFLTAGLSIGFGGSLVSAQSDDNADMTASSGYGRENEHKYYKSIELEYGDTLWDIAMEYRDSHYDSIQDYIRELKEINNLLTDDIHADRYLTVVYYDI